MIAGDPDPATGAVAPTTTSLRVLLIEGTAEDAEVNLRALRRSRYDPVWERVETGAAVWTKLTEQSWDLILCDYTLPSFDALGALRIVRELGIDVPFIVISGTVDEAVAIETMRLGAHDYVQKGMLLGVAVERELRSFASRRLRREADLARHRSEERHRVLIEHSTDAVVVAGIDGTLSYASPAFGAVFGSSSEAVLGSALESWIYTEDRPVVRQALQRALASPSEDIRLQMRAAHRDGGVRLLECIFRSRVTTPAVNGVIVNARDVSQRWATESERRARTRAELASKTKSSFLANMSHELRTPLNAIIGFADLMDQGISGPLSEKQGLYVTNVLQAGRHLLSLVNDILDLSKIEAGKLELCREWTSVASIASSVERVLAPLALDRGVALGLEVGEALPAFYVDPLRLKQILLNLVANALKFTPRGGGVRISARGDATRLAIAVEDDGVGIAPEDMPRLFREFEQLDVPMSGPGGEPRERVEGTGLGLALTKRLVEMHGASIEARSTVGKGTTFTVVFADVGRPLQVVDSRPPSNRRGNTPRPHPRGPAPVLIVDGDPKAAALLSAHVRAGGLPTLIASGLVQTLQLAAQARPVAITLDIMMPNIDGWAILRCLKEEPSTAGIPVIMVSFDDDDLLRGRELGAAAHLTKPVSSAALHAALRTAGVSVRSVAGRHVLLVGESSMDAFAEVLLGAGCRVTRRSGVGSMAVVRPDVDVAVVEYRGEPSGSFATTLDSPAPYPIVAIVDTLPPGAPPAGLTYVEWGDEEEAEDLIGHLHGALLRTRPGNAS